MPVSKNKTKNLQNKQESSWTSGSCLKYICTLRVSCEDSRLLQGGRYNFKGAPPRPGLYISFFQGVLIQSRAAAEGVDVKVPNPLTRIHGLLYPEDPFRAFLSDLLGLFHTHPGSRVTDVVYPYCWEDLSFLTFFPTIV